MQIDVKCNVCFSKRRLKHFICIKCEYYMHKFIKYAKYTKNIKLVADFYA